MQDWYDFGITDAANGGSILAPRIRTSDFGLADIGDGMQQLGILGGDYGLWSGLNNLGHNFQVVGNTGDMLGYTTSRQWDPNAGFQVQVKSADKQGSLLNYERQGDYYVPTSYGGTQAWNTSPTAFDYAPLAILAGGAAGALANAGMLGAVGASGAGSTGTAYGLLDTSLSLAPGAWAPAAGTASSVVGGAGGMLGGAEGAVQWLPSSDVFGAAEVAAGAPTSITQAATGAAGAGGLFNGSASDIIKNLLGSDVLSKLAPSAVQAITGLISDRQARDAQTELFNNNANAAGQYRDAQLQYADKLSGMFGETNPRYGQFRDRYFDAAGNVLDQALDFNPQTFAKERFDAMQGLLAPQRAQQQAGLMQDLYTKGGFGLSLNTPTQNGVQGINPYVNSLTSAWAQQDKQMAYDSLNQGESYLDNLLRRQTGLFGSGANADSILTNRGTQVYGAQRDATTRYIEAMLKAQNERTGANAAAGSERNAAVGSIVENLPWGSIWSSLGGLFGSKA